MAQRVFPGGGEILPKKFGENVFSSKFHQKTATFLSSNERSKKQTTAFEGNLNIEACEGKNRTH